MFGRHYFTDRDWIRRYDRDFAVWQQAEIRLRRDFDRNPVTPAEKDAIFTALEPAYQNWRRDVEVLARHREEEQAQIWKGISELDIRSLPERNFDRPKLKPFKLEYDTLQEVQMRFRQTVIQIRGNPFYVSDVRKVKDKFHLLLENVKDQKSQTCIDEIDFRGVPPGYVILNGTHGWMRRIPARVNQQGMTTQNTSISRISTGDGMPFNNKHIVHAIESKGKTLPWSGPYRDLMVNGVIPEMRLSDEVAVYTKRGVDGVYVGYQGRTFGKMIEGNVVSALDEDDLIQPWIGKHFQKVNLEIVKT